MWAKSVKKYYDMGIYTDENVATFVRAGMITEEDYKDITGKKYAK